MIAGKEEAQLSHWQLIDMNRAVRGVIKGHPSIPDGSVIYSATIVRHHSWKSPGRGRSWVETLDTMYELVGAECDDTSEVWKATVEAKQNRPQVAKRLIHHANGGSSYDCGADARAFWGCENWLGVTCTPCLETKHPYIRVVNPVVVEQEPEQEQLTLWEGKP